MQPTPPYRSEDLRAAYHLRYGWTGWTFGGAPFPAAVSDAFLADLAPLWEQDGLRLLESNCRADKVQCTFSAKPSVSPVLFAGRAKGRLQHALRTHGTPLKFSRKVAVRSIGDNRTSEMQQYIEQQVGKEPLADERFRDQLDEFTVVDPDVDLSQPTASNSGRYWYNLHLVLVVRERGRVNDLSQLAAIRDCSRRIAEKKGYRVSRLSVLPDHVHASLRGNIEHSPEEIALAFLNNLAFALGQNAIWQHGYYVATFSEYDIDAVREFPHGTCSPAGRAGGGLEDGVLGTSI